MDAFLNELGDLVNAAPHAIDAAGQLSAVWTEGGAAARLKGATSHEALTQLGRRIDRLSLACQAMWELLREKTDLTEEQLRDKILEVDLRDGATDNKMAPAMMECPHCKARITSRRTNCVMCGLEVPRRHQFET